MKKLTKLSYSSMLFLFLKHNFLLICILVLASFFRLYALDSVPPSPSLDEVSIGWNAYSILKTGKDEYGYRLPVLLRAYDDYRPALYVYTVIPFVAALGLQTISIRLPSVILSVFSIVSIYYIVLLLFENTKTKQLLALSVSLLMAVSPWHIYLSRLGHEVNGGLAFVIFGTLFFLLALKYTKHLLYLPVSFICFNLSLYTYQSEKVVTPLLVCALVIIFRKKLLHIKTSFFLAIFISVIMISPILKASLSPQALIRFRGTSIFTEENPQYQTDRQKFMLAKERNDYVGRLIFNPRFSSVKIFVTNYVKHLNPNWLFFGGPYESHKVPYLGLLYIWEYLLIIIGISYLLFAHTIHNSSRLLIILWLLCSFIPGAITTQAPHAMRVFTVLPMLEILSGIGLFNLLIRFRYFGIIISFILLLSLVYFSKEYFFIFPRTQSDSFQYALHQTIKYVIHTKNLYKAIVFSNKDNLYQSYMFYLYNSKYDPRLYLENGGTKSGGFAEMHTIQNIEFRPISVNEEFVKGILYVGNLSDFRTDVHQVNMIYNLNNKPVIELVGTTSL